MGANTEGHQQRRIPVILDTDIGYDIDDTWALALMLRCPELEPRLIVSDSRNTVYSAAIIARLLEVARKTEIAVGVGIYQHEMAGGQLPWVDDYELESYPGQVHQDGVSALIDTIMQSPEPITLICIGPVPNIAEALRREPRIAEHTRFVGMHGSIRRAYNDSPLVDAEYNVAADPRAAQAVFSAPWDMTITPLDTCGVVTLTAENYQQILDCQDPLVQALIDNYRTWLRSRGRPALWEEQSSVLFDTVAIYLAFSEELLSMERLNITVTGAGRTVIDREGKEINCATAWKDLPAFEDFLVRRLTGESRQ